MIWKSRAERKKRQQKESTRQLMGIRKIGEHSIRTTEGRRNVFLVKPDNLSVLSEADILTCVKAMTDLLQGVEQVDILALDSRESFQRNKDYYALRLEQETVPALRELLRQDMEHLDRIQTTTASSREFALIYEGGRQPEEDAITQLTAIEKHIKDSGFHVRMANAEDIKRLLAVYYQQDVTTETFENYDGEAAMTHG